MRRSSNHLRQRPLREELLRRKGAPSSLIVCAGCRCPDLLQKAGACIGQPDEVLSGMQSICKMKCCIPITENVFMRPSDNGPEAGLLRFFCMLQ